MTYLKGLYFAIFLAVFTLPSSFAQNSSSQPSQPIAPKSPLSLIVDQPDESVSDTFSAKPDLSQPMELIPLKSQKPAKTNRTRSSMTQQNPKALPISKKSRAVGTKSGQ